MAAVSQQDFRADNPHLAKEEHKHGKLKHHAHHQRQRYECRHIRIKRDGTVNASRDTVHSQEAERDGKQHKVCHQYADKKQGVNRTRHLHRIAPLVLTERRRDKAEQLIQYVERSAKQAEVHGRSDVCHELA